MLSPTLRVGLDRYAIGPKLRALRLRKKMGLVELGRHTGLSAAMLSKVERGRVFPTLPTLLRIALVFGVGLEHFFLEARAAPTVALVRREDRRRFPDRPGARATAYHFESLDYPATERPMNSYYVEFEPGVESRVHQHDGAESIYVLDGKLGVRIGEEQIVVRKGDSLYFDATQPHCYLQVGPGHCRAIVTTA